MLNRAGHRTRKGDTLIEVMFAVGIFGLAAIGTVSLMNRGLASSQNTLEVTMARQEIDAQAEALRFLQSAYISEPKKAEETPIEDVCKTPVSYRDLWKCLVTNYVYASDSSNPGMNSVTYEDRDFYTRTTELGQHCDDLFRTNDANAFSLPSKSFVLNPRKLDISDLDSSKKEDVAKLASQLKGVIVNNTVNDKPITLASTFPRLIYDDNNGNLSTLSDASVDSSSKALVFGDTQKNLYSSEGIWVTGVTSPSGVRCSGDDEGAIRPDYYDFHIQTCWDSMASDSASTIGSTVRLFNPDQVSLTSKKTTIDFVNTEWKTHKSSTTSKVDNCSNSSGNHSDINAGGADNKTLRLVGYTCDEANEGVYTDIDANGNYTVQFTIKANKFSTHPGGYFIAKLGPLEVAIYSGGNFQELTVDGNGKLRPINVYGIIEDSRPVQELPDIGSKEGNYFVEGNDLSYIHEDKDGIKGSGYYNPGSKVRKAIPLFLVSDNYNFPETIVATLTKTGNTYTATIGGYESESVTFENNQSSNLQIGFWMMHYSHNCNVRYDVEAKVDISVNTAKSEDGSCYRVAANTADEGSINIPTDDTNPAGNDPTPKPTPTPTPEDVVGEVTFENASWEIYDNLAKEHATCKADPRSSDCTYNAKICRPYYNWIGTDFDGNTISICTETTGDHVVVSDNNIRFLGYNLSEMTEGARYKINSTDYFQIESNIYTGNILIHPENGQFIISLGAISANLTASGGAFTINGEEVARVRKNNFTMKLTKNGNEYTVQIDDGEPVTRTVALPGDQYVDFYFHHDGHTCEKLSNVYVSNIKMTRYHEAPNP